MLQQRKNNMPRTTVAGNLTKLVNRLMAERQEHLAAAAEIEAVFTDWASLLTGKEEWAQNNQRQEKPRCRTERSPRQAGKLQADRARVSLEPSEGQGASHGADHERVEEGRQGRQGRQCPG